MDHIKSIVDEVLRNSEFTIDTHTISSTSFDQMEIDVNKIIDNDIAGIISSVAFFSWFNRIKAKSPKYYILSICLDWDEIGIDLLNSDTKKVGCISRLSRTFIEALLMYMHNNNIPIRTYEITFADAMEMVNDWLYSKQ